MGILSGIPVLGGILDKIAGRFLPDKGESRQAQAKINEQEVSGAPASRLRLWRSFLGWALAIAFCWEVIGRPVITTYWPHITLPSSVLKEISTVLLGMLGLGF
jgi:hypothetical protein